MRAEVPEQANVSVHRPSRVQGSSKMAWTTGPALLRPKRRERAYNAARDGQSERASEEDEQEGERDSGKVRERTADDA